MINVLIFKPSHRCNFNCSYCYDRFERSKDASIMSVDSAIKILEKAYKENPKMEIIWHGGEPMLLGKEYLDKVMSHFPENSFFWSIQTNGSFIDEEWIELFKKHKVHVGLSWDGTAHNTTRKQIDMFKIFNLFKEANVEFPGLLMTLTPQNAPSLLETYILAEQNNWHISFGTLFGEIITPEEYDKMLYYLLQLFDYICVNKKASVSRPFDALIGFFSGEPIKICENKICANRWIGVNPHGDLIPCGKPWSKEYIFGNILENENISFQDILKTEKYQTFIQTSIENWDSCRHCKYLLGCNGGCIHNNLDPNSITFKKNENYCHFKYSLFEGVKKVLEYRYKTGTLINEKIIEKLSNSYKGEFAKWKNYKSPII